MTTPDLAAATERLREAIAARDRQITELKRLLRERCFNPDLDIVQVVRDVNAALAEQLPEVE